MIFTIEAELLYQKETPYIQPTPPIRLLCSLRMINRIGSALFYIRMIPWGWAMFGAIF
ncbi:MAG: hypothetical protein IEMM0002_0123 [bacterium]|nr:MAG: hypothetical protein IEMM0002_0123 [bacterium]